MFLCGSCNTNNNDSVSLNIDNADFVVKFDLIGPSEHYVIVLTQNNKVLAYYENSQKYYEEICVELDDTHTTFIYPYLEKALNLSADEIEGYVNMSHFYMVTMYYNNQKTTFNYGASASIDVNILLEQLIGCCNFESNRAKENLKPAGAYFREYFELYDKEKSKS